MVVICEKCYVCGEVGNFTISEGSTLLREAVCGHCHASIRHSDMAKALTDYFSNGEALKEAIPHLQDLQILNTSPLGESHRLLSQLPGCVSSEYFPNVPCGELSENGILCVDLRKMPFSDNRFDLILTEEVLEHIEELDWVFSEINRVLKPGGVHIFTVPVCEQASTRSIADLDVTHPAFMAGNSKVYHEFGLDIAPQLEKYGFKTTYRMGHRFIPADGTTDFSRDYPDYCEKRETPLSFFQYNSIVFTSKKMWNADAAVERLELGAAPSLQLVTEHLHRYQSVLALVAGKQVLDAACGSGYGSQLMAQQAAHVTGIDIDVNVVERLKRENTKDNLTFYQMSITELEFPEHSFDVVISFETIEHVDETAQRQFLREIRRVLKPGGCLVISSPNLDVLREIDPIYFNPFHIKEYTRTEFYDLMRSQFAHVTAYDQNVVEASCITGDGAAVTANNPENQTGKYLIALCSDRELPAVSLAGAYFPAAEAYYAELQARSTVLAHLFVDTGDGFLAEQVVAVPSNYRWGHFQIAFDISKFTGVRAVRFDPLEGQFCRCNIVQCCADGMPVPVLSNNATCSVDGVDFFLHHDPQYVIQVPDGLVGTIEIEGNLDFEVHRMIEQLYANGLLYRQALLVEQAKAAQQQEKLDGYSRHLAKRDCRLADYANQLADRDDQLADFDNRLNEATQRMQMSESELERMAAYARQVEDLYHQLAAQYNMVLGSRCWRMTAPIRRVLDWVKAKKSVWLVYKGLRYLHIFGVRQTLKKTRRFLAGRLPVIDTGMSAASSFDNLVKQLKKNAVRGAQLVYLPDVLKSYDKNPGRKILLVSHELDLTGAPVALRYFAQCLKDAGYCPVILSHHEGNLADVIAADNIPVMVCPTLLTSNVLENFVGLFDLVVASTIVMAPVVSLLSGTNVPVLWWIHEAAVSYVPPHLEKMPKVLAPNVVVRTGGTYARLLLKKHRPLYDVDDLLYYVPDFSDKSQADTGAFVLPDATVGKTLFCLVGMLEQRKGQDILADAILELSPEHLAASFFVFVGRQCYPPHYKKIMELCNRFPDNVFYVEELVGKELHNLYERMDCLICASRDDPMPIVVTEAMQHSKLIICSENTGSAALLRQEHGGFVYTNNNPHELALNIVQVLEKACQFDSIRCAARRTYEKYFSHAVFDKNVMTLVRSMLQGNAPGAERLTQMGDSLTMASFAEAYKKAYIPGDQFELADTLLGYDRTDGAKRVLLVSHELSLTGAPIALLYLAESYRRQGVQVVVISPSDGPLAEELISEGIPTVVYTKLYQDDFLAAQSGKFDLIVLSTVVTYRAINQLSHSETPVLWWIHDSLASYQVGGFEACMPRTLPENVSVVCGGEYAREQLLKYYPDYSSVGLFYYMVPDLAAAAPQYPVYDMGRDSVRTAFAVIGLQDIRKGHDIFAKAIELLTDEERARSQFYFIGRHLDEPIRKAVDTICARYPGQVTYITEVNRQELFSVYLQVDCVVCSSKDDPLPVFVTEALMMSTLVICSEHTGSAPILEREQCGLVYHNNDPAELAEKMREVLNGTNRLEDMRLRGREAYCKYFSRDVFDGEAGRLLSQLSYVPEENSAHVCVSVVIPAYNGGAQMEELLRRLRDQRGIRQVEIVVVDSGSSDSTPTLCRQYGATIIEIPQSEFSHSYSRNLGALHAHGDILLFMTQDALPDDAFWMRRMVEPILAGEATATSCMEQCPPETELYYSAASWYHARYMGVDEGDQLSSGVACKTFDELRSHASLNDISTAIRKDVFSNYLYRFNYAEDLDLGLRLLKSGHAIKLLASAKVVHGHNRPAGYYIKRGLVESKALGKIDSAWAPSREEEQTVARKLYHGEAILRRAMTQAYAQSQGAVYELYDFFSLLLRQLQQAKDSSEGLPEDAIPMPQRDSLLAWCIEVVKPYAGERISCEDELIDQCGYYLESSLLPFLEHKNVLALDVEQQAAVYDCLEKQFCLATGNLLARLDENTALFAELKTLTQGV